VTDALYYSAVIAPPPVSALRPTRFRNSDRPDFSVGQCGFSMAVCLTATVTATFVNPTEVVNDLGAEILSGSDCYVCGTSKSRFMGT
jgi:hypothetical protein